MRVGKMPSRLTSFNLLACFWIAHDPCVQSSLIQRETTLVGVQADGPIELGWLYQNRALGKARAGTHDIISLQAFNKNCSVDKRF